MAHTTEIQGFTFTHDGDYSGEVEVQDTSDPGGAPFAVPFSALAAFVAGYVVGEKIREIENAATLDILMGKV